MGGEKREVNMGTTLVTGGSPENDGIPRTVPRAVRRWSRSAPRGLSVGIRPLLDLCVCVLLTASVWGGGSASQLGLEADPALNLTPQNERVAVFSDSYGAFDYPEHLGTILGCEVLQRTRGGTAGEALEYCGFFSEPGNEYGVIITNYGSADRVRDLPWEETEADLRDLFRRLKATGAIVVYNQVVPESTAPYGRVCQEEGVIVVSNWADDIFNHTSKIPYPIYQVTSGNIHPNTWGYSALAERTARVMVDLGLAEYGMDLGELSREVSANLSKVEADMKVLEDRNHTAPSDLKDAYEAVRSLDELGSFYTAKLLLVDKILPRVVSVLENWDKVKELFSQASECIETLRQQGDSRQVMISEADYDRAEKAWADYDYLAAYNPLNRVTGKCPEPRFLAILGLGLLLLLLRGAKR